MMVGCIQLLGPSNNSSVFQGLPHPKWKENSDLNAGDVNAGGLNPGVKISIMNKSLAISLVYT